MKRRTLILASLAASAAGGASAETFPSQPVKVVVPFPPGGGTDALARAIQEPMQKALGQTVIIDNKGGAGGNLAHDYVAKQPPDGHTVLFSSNNQMLYPFLVAKLGYDPAAFVPIGFVAKQESVFVGSADAPWADLAAITEAARKAPGDVQYGTAGVSTPMHLSDRALCAPEQDQTDARAVSRHRPAGYRSFGRSHQARHVEPDERGAAHRRAASSRPTRWPRPSARRRRLTSRRSRSWVPATSMARSSTR